MRSLVEELAELSLLAEYRPASGTIRLHDVLRAFAWHRLGQADRFGLTATLIEAYATQLAGVEAPNRARPWWTLPDRATYMWRHVGPGKPTCSDP